MVKTYVIAGLGLAALTATAVFAQPREEAAQDETANEEVTREEIRRAPPDPEELRKSLQEKAQKIPRRGLVSALRAERDGRANRAETVIRAPNLVELRADLQRTEQADAERPSLREQLSATQALSTARLSAPPPPGIRAMSASNLRSADQEEINRVRIPVLIPADPSVRDRIKVYGMENVYTATAIIDAAATLSITGTCNRVVGGDPDIVAFRKRLAEQPRRLDGTGAAYHISRNDFGVDLSFSKFGCGYVMTIECDDPAADQRCAGDDYITGLADSMILANPALASGGE
ncbi:hypothetical protein PUV54_07835 [Hyphococcus flavus]|uniref:Uncharacterized protein n=1 Tax=Hyphococcus flavus TaxID=1866326 RepID=A0AAE9ZLT4_9PROT|nr:hypothetical protein [Hyphococcus flavus]WDI33105.1 hypothetical protein PUV54_07835 [Hyphococcus flavus]